MSGYLVIDGTGGNHASTPDAAALDITSAEIAAKAFTEDSANAATVTLNGTAWRYIWGSSLGAGGPQRFAGSGQMLRTGRAQI